LGKRGKFRPPLREEEKHVSTQELTTRLLRRIGPVRAVGVDPAVPQQQPEGGAFPRSESGAAGVGTRTLMGDDT